MRQCVDKNKTKSIDACAAYERDDYRLHFRHYQMYLRFAFSVACLCFCRKTNGCVACVDFEVVSDYLYTHMAPVFDRFAVAKCNGKQMKTNHTEWRTGLRSDRTNSRVRRICVHVQLCFKLTLEWMFLMSIFEINK